MTPEQFHAACEKYLAAHKDVASFLASGFTLINGIWQPVEPTTAWHGGTPYYLDPPKLMNYTNKPGFAVGVDYGWKKPGKHYSISMLKKQIEEAQLFIHDDFVMSEMVKFQALKQKVKAAYVPPDDWASVFPSSETKFNPSMMVNNVSRDLIAESYRLDRRDEAERN